MVKVYVKGNFLCFDDGESQRLYAFQSVYINALADSETIAFAQSNDNQILAQTYYAELKDEAGNALGNNFADVLDVLSELTPEEGSSVTISNFPNPQTISGAVSVSNFPATQPVSGSVTVAGVATSANQDLQNTKLDALNSTPFYDRVSAGLVSGYSFVKKAGRNPDLDSGSVPEDAWNGGGTYTGFPTGAPEELQVFSSSASDTSVLTITYLANSSSTSYQTAQITLTGTTPVNTGIVAYRMHTASYNTTTPTGANVGNITVRHRTTTANLFCFMPIGSNQTYVGAYTVPAGNTALLKSYNINVGGATSAYVEGVFFTRLNNTSPRYRRNFFAQVGQFFNEIADGSVAFPALTDIIPRFTFASANNLIVNASYDLLIIPS